MFEKAERLDSIILGFCIGVVFSVVVIAIMEVI